MQVDQGPNVIPAAVSLKTDHLDSSLTANLIGLILSLKPLCRNAMKNLVRISSDKVFDYWRGLENCPASSSLRPDILNETFPASTKWSTANIERVDIQETFMLPVPDFGPLSKNSWQLPPAAEYFAQTFAAGMYDPNHPYNADKMRRLLSWPDRHASRVILVSDNQAGPFTILDGNHRAVLLMHEGAIIGASVYLGLHSAMRQFSWAERSFARKDAITS